MKPRSTPVCPQCRSENVVPIVYGYPGPEAAQSAEQGRIHLGGCCVSGRDPEWHCEDCDYAWGDTGRSSLDEGGRERDA